MGRCVKDRDGAIGHSLGSVDRIHGINRFCYRVGYCDIPCYKAFTAASILFRPSSRVALGQAMLSL